MVVSAEDVRLGSPMTLYTLRNILYNQSSVLILVHLQPDTYCSPLWSTVLYWGPLLNYFPVPRLPSFLSNHLLGMPLLCHCTANNSLFVKVQTSTGE